MYLLGLMPPHAASGGMRGDVDEAMVDHSGGPSWDGWLGAIWSYA